MVIELSVGTEAEKMYTENTCHVGKLWDRGYESAKIETKLRNELLKRCAELKARPSRWFQLW